MNRLLQPTHLKRMGYAMAFIAMAAHASAESVIYTMDNAADANHVMVFQLGNKSDLASTGSVATGGLGTGAGLSSQGSVLLSDHGDWLFVCNAGSDEISVFATTPGGLRLMSRVNSGGRMPVSLTLHRNVLYVLNAGGGIGDKDNVTAFLFAGGSLVALPGSTRALSGDNTGPAQVSFTPDGNALIVTERLTNLIDIFTLGDDGSATSHKLFLSAGTTPFGFSVGRNDRIFVSEASGVPNGSSASSYTLSEGGDLALISGQVATEQNAACWLILSHNGRFAYTANAASGSISGFRIGPDGSLSLLQPGGVSAVTGVGSHPVDMTESHDGRFLFALANGNGTLGAFRVTGSGTLEPLGFTGGIPTSAAGLASH